MAQQYASWAAEDTRESSTLPSDFDATILSAVFTKDAPENYNPGEGNDPIFAKIAYYADFERLPGEADDDYESRRHYTQEYSVGGSSGKEFSISDDGFGLIPLNDTVTAIRRGSKFDLWKCALEGQGVSKVVTKAGSLAAFAGLRGRWMRVDDAKLLGKAREFTDDKRKSKFPPQTLVMVKLIALPGEKGKGGPAVSTSAATPAAAASNGGDFDLDSATMDYLLKVIEASPSKTVQRSTLVLALNKAAMHDIAHRKDIGKRGADESFLVKLAEAGIISYDPASKPQIVGMAA